MVVKYRSIAGVYDMHHVWSIDFRRMRLDTDYYRQQRNDFTRNVIDVAEVTLCKGVAHNKHEDFKEKSSNVEKLDKPDAVLAF